jgi:tRNA dimethylallyltransferase
MDLPDSSFLSPDTEDQAVRFGPIAGNAVVLTGPTASGKSGVSIDLAERIGGEIISVDSIAVYRGMDIGTAKPSPNDRQRVPHHLIDVASPANDYSVANYLSAAWQAMEDIRSRGRIPMFVGGTPMYLKGLLYGFDPGPPADWQFRRDVEADLAEHGPEALHKRLWQVDPLSAHRLSPTDVRRVTRALEVAYLTGQPLSHRQTQFDQTPDSLGGRLFVIHWPREELHKRIEQRVAEMFRSGLVDEVRGLIDMHGKLSRTAEIAVGYREVIALLDGKINEKTAIDEVTAHTRQLARRQETWLRSLKSLEVLEVSRDEELLILGHTLAGRLLEHRFS